MNYISDYKEYEKHKPNFLTFHLNGENKLLQTSWKYWNTSLWSQLSRHFQIHLYKTMLKNGFIQLHMLHYAKKN